MLCENCKKKDATSIYMSPNENKIKYLCGSCYRKINNELELEAFAMSQTKDVTLEAKCSCCGETFEEFKSSGLLACENCYKAFEEELNLFINQFKNPIYLGKKPNAFYMQKQIKELEQMVEICLKNGNYQKATKYGIELQQLKEQSYGKL